MSNVFETLQERGFVQQSTNEVNVAHLLSGNPITYYVGFDPTADSLHAGSLVPIMAIAHLQRTRHKPIAIIGGTTMIGDPTDKTEMRPMISTEQVEKNGTSILKQLQRYLDLDNTAGVFLNNAVWLLP